MELANIMLESKSENSCLTNSSNSLLAAFNLCKFKVLLFNDADSS